MWQGRAMVEELIDAWHQQDDLCALVVTPPWLSLQLPRFNADTGEKTQQPYIVPGMLRLPVFAEADTQAVAWCNYEVHSIIRHHGPTFRAGHYTVLVRGDTDFLLDDDQQPKSAPFRAARIMDWTAPVAATERERWLSRQLYLLEIWIKQLVKDNDALQERMDTLDRRMSYIMLRLPVGITAGGRNKAVPERLPIALDTLDD
ncbi:Pol [Symbiodinium necroappetens]|uniref:Pol protein n=1 Tax=Symbiodinium necroappetens TaxID=1628268 RepID=A0A812WZY8_9DINO|nr:Pol [Symbiodinium necroappetens]